ncbi:MAG: hypothetical protein Q7J54_06110 [Candidatus Woesearchaeota archaeon]|nr:hypothetical protein [Candidatus Woesearchaeota archaeon]
MASKTHTGGNFEFVDDGKKLSHTESTEDFTESYKKWVNRPYYKREWFWKTIIVLMILVIIIYFLFYYIGKT